MTVAKLKAIDRWHLEHPHRCFGDGHDVLPHGHRELASRWSVAGPGHRAPRTSPTRPARSTQRGSTKRRGRPRLFSLSSPFKPPQATADTVPMSLTLTPPTRLVAIAGALLLTGLAAVVFILGRGALGGEESATTASTPLVRQPDHDAGKTGTKPHDRRRSPSPPPRERLAGAGGSRASLQAVVVVSVSIPHAAVDAVVRRRPVPRPPPPSSGFVSLSALNEHAMTQLVAKAGVCPTPRSRREATRASWRRSR